jgi:hypothetical protein
MEFLLPSDHEIVPESRQSEFDQRNHSMEKAAPAGAAFSKVRILPEI